MVSFSSILPNQLGYTLATPELKLRFIHRIGKGSYGQVYLAWDMSTPESAPRFYAVKCTLKYEPGTEYAALQQKEVALHGALSSHPSITTLHYIVEEQYYHYMVMEYHDGGDLYSAIVDRQTFHHNDDAVKASFVQLIDAVQACHDLGISHRDLKPENVMCMKEDGRVSLSDFGLATQSGLSDSYGCGSAHYMSPECIGSVETTAPYSPRRSDIWSLGIILINMLTQRNPWQLAHAGRDEGFAAYLRRRGAFLRSILALSDEAAALLACILDPAPATRITLPQLRARVLAVRTFFPPDGLPGCVHAADALLGAPREESLVDEEAPWADEEDEDIAEIMEVPREAVDAQLAQFDMGAARSSSAAAFVSVPLDSSVAHSQASTFVNQSASVSSLDTDETAPPATPVSPASEIPHVVPYLTLDAGETHMHEEDVVTPMAEDGPQGRMSKGMRRFVGAMRRVVWA